MVRGLWVVLSMGIFLLGLSSLSLTLYLWFGDWPATARETVDHYRSVAENTGRPPDPTVGNVAGRAQTSLNGTWQAVIDPYGRGGLGGFAPRAAEAQEPADHSEFSFENGLTLEVPGDWNTQDPRLAFYRGTVWYKRTFDAPASDARRFLYFGAVNYRTSVYLNGRLLGEHVGGFTPFNFEVGPHLQEGENLLVLRVSNEKTTEDVPGPTTDWLNYGGVTRDVSLVEVPRVFIRDYEVGLAGGGHDRIDAWVQLDGEARGESIELQIPELGLAARAEADASGRAVFELAARPVLWSPEQPKLYRVELASNEDRVSEEIGFRTIEVRGEEILLNGEPIFLRGISLHEEAPGGGRAIDEAAAEALLGWAVELEANFVRLAHYPHDERMARTADRLGLLVWEEIPVYWELDFASPRTLAHAEEQLSELIARDRNRASVILWSLGNETPEGEHRDAFFRTLAAHVRELDDSRLVTAALLTGPTELVGFFLRYYVTALLGWHRPEWVMEVNDPLAEVVDVPAVNEYFGWYYSGALGLVSPFSSHTTRSVMLDHMDRIRIRTPPGKPLVISEFGAGALAGKRAPEEELAAYSEDYQALVYRRQTALLDRQPQLRGVSPWVLKDFRSPLRLYQGVQDYWNRKGLVSHEGKKKLAFGVLRDYYREVAAR